MLTHNVADVDGDRSQSDHHEDGPARPARQLVRKVLPILALAVVVVVVLLVRTWNADSGGAASTPAAGIAQPAMPTSPAIEEKYGVRFIGVDVTSGGGMIQIRYQVLDSAKTEAIHDQTAAPYVIDSRGAKYADPGMVGHSHIGPVKAAGTTDYVLLANARGGVKPGSVVTIRIGDLELQSVPVQ